MEKNDNSRILTFYRTLCVCFFSVCGTERERERENFIMLPVEHGLDSGFMILNSLLEKSTCRNSLEPPNSHVTLDQSDISLMLLGRGDEWTLARTVAVRPA